MADYDVVVIGAGNSGLTGAVTLAQAGVKTLILERHNIPGGCATSFVRGRFEFEVALHQLSGMGSENFPGPTRTLFNNLGIMDKLKLVQNDTLYRMISPGKYDVRLKADRTKMSAALKGQFPKEADNIDRFFDLLYEFCTQWIAVTIMLDPEASPSKYPLFFKYALKMYQDILDEYFDDTQIKNTLSVYWSYIGLPPSRLPFGDMAIVIWAYTEFKPYHINGGSQSLSNALISSYLEAGGEVRFNCGVIKINVSNGNITGVITEDGDEISASRVLSNAGTYTTYVELIDREHVPDSRLKELGARSVGTSFVACYIGFDRKPDDLGITDSTNFITTSDDPEIAWSTSKTLNPPKLALFSCYDVDDPDFSPAGLSHGSLVSLAYAEPWLKIPPTLYNETKLQYAQKMLEMLYQVFPKCRNHIEEIEVSSPLTHMRYLGHPGGAPYGFDKYAKDFDRFKETAFSPIGGLYHCGAWHGRGGFQPTLIAGQSAGKEVIQSLKG